MNALKYVITRPCNKLYIKKLYTNSPNLYKAVSEIEKMVELDKLKKKLHLQKLAIKKMKKDIVETKKHLQKASDSSDFWFWMWILW